jgi:hypothetical protein
MRLHLAVLVAAGVAGAAIAAISATDEPMPPQPAIVRFTSVPAADSLTSLRQEVELLKEKVERPRTAVVTADEVGDEAPTIAPAASDAVTTPSKAGASATETAEILEAQYASEPFERAWSEKLYAELQTALAAQDTRSTVSSAQCTTSLCKVSVLHETVDAQRELASNVVSLPALSTGVFYHYEAGTTLPRTVLYVVREGHDIRELLAAQ